MSTLSGSINEEYAGITLAASCITLQLLGSSFHPVFTHQSFEDERILGYEPAVGGADRTHECAGKFQPAFRLDSP